MGRSVQEQQGRLLPRNEFNLAKFKFTKDGIKVSHYIKGESSHIDVEVEEKPHPDLIEKTKELQLYMATRLGLLEGWDFSREKVKSNQDDLKLAMQGHKDALERCNINGLTFLGEGETYGVTITGSIKTPKSGSVGLAVPKITFGKNDLGYEEDVENICDEIKDEVYNFLILKKKEQTNIEDQAEGFDNNGGQMTIDDGFDENGERDFVPGKNQIEEEE